MRGRSDLFQVFVRLRRGALVADVPAAAAVAAQRLGLLLMSRACSASASGSKSAAVTGLWFIRSAGSPDMCTSFSRV